MNGKSTGDEEAGQIEPQQQAGAEKTNDFVIEEGVLAEMGKYHLALRVLYCCGKWVKCTLIVCVSVNFLTTRLFVTLSHCHTVTLSHSPILPLLHSRGHHVRCRSGVASEPNRHRTRLLCHLRVCVLHACLLLRSCLERKFLQDLPLFL